MKLQITNTLIILLCIIGATQAHAQRKKADNTIRIEGTITDETTGETLPLTNVYIKGTLMGVTSDFDGHFTIDIPEGTDSLWFNSMGYTDKSLPTAQMIGHDNQVQLRLQTYSIGEIYVSPDDAPRRLLRQVLANKKRNDPENYERAKYEKYARWEYALNNISDAAQENWLLRGSKGLMTIDEDSVRSLPVYFTETITRNETQKNPRKIKSTVVADNTRGLEVVKEMELDGFSGGMTTDASFYDNVVRITNSVGFVSPIADNALTYYKYYITDSCYTADSTKIYTLKYRPRFKGDKTFIGTMDVETKYYSVMRIDAEMPKTTNINFVKKLEIKSTYQLVNDSLPFYKTNSLTIHADYIPTQSDKKRLELKMNMFYSMKDVVLNSDEPVVLSAKQLSYETLRLPDYRNADTAFWRERRHVQYTPEEEQTLTAIDSLNNVGTMHVMGLLAKMSMTGYYDVGRLEIGPHTDMFNTNKIEGLHLGFGLRTSKEISERWVVSGLVGYGFRNERPTYGASVGYKFRSPFRRTIEVRYQDKLVKIGENDNILYLYENMLTTSETNILAQLTKREEIDELMYERKLKLKYEHEWITGISSKLGFEARWQFSPKFYPFERGGKPIEKVEMQEVMLDTRFSFLEKYIDDGMQRIYMTTKWPVVHITVAGGRAAVDGDESLYARLHSTIKHSAFWGQTKLEYAAEGGLYFGKLPYSLLEMPRGNKTYGLYRYDFNMMNYLEFVNDKYLYLYVDYYLNGFLFNRVPLMHYLGLREVVGFKAMVGAMSEKHKTMLDLPSKVYDLDGGYIELNAGIENILKLLRIDAIWRVTNAKESGAPSFGIRAQLKVTL